MNKPYTFKTPFQEFIYTRTYSRWRDDLGRREMWQETVARYCDYIKSKLGDKILDKEIQDVQRSILNMEVMPSMRLLWSAGPAAEADNMAGYNCAYVSIENLKNLSEVLYILMNGTGVGFSVEKQFISKLPEIKEKNLTADKEVIVFEDSKRGWAEGYEKVLKCIWNGVPFECDYSKIRPRGARLKTFGGRASGPLPLKSLVEFTSVVVEKSRGYQMSSMDLHDIICKIADVVVVGGVRRSALLSLSDLTDNQIANCKSGEFWMNNPQRSLANNSVAYTRKPDIISFMNEWENLIRSESGERGIFNREAAQRKASENHRRDGSRIVGVNPCGEVLLPSKSCCNLTEVVIRPEDDFTALKRKVKLATMMGTWQATFTDFKYISKDWKKNCEEERLLGVSLTGLRDHPVLGYSNDTAKKWLSDLKHIAIQTNKKIAERLGIARATAITVVKPSGTVSLLVDSSPGGHVRPTATGYYLRRVRISATDPICKMLQEVGIPLMPEVGQSLEGCNTFVVEFPCKTLKGALLKDKDSAQEQLDYWKMLRDFWCEGNPSITIYVKEDEWLDTAAWVYRNFDNIGGLSFLPSSDHVYQLAPFEDISKEDYERRVVEFPEIDFKKLSEYEKEDQTEGSREYACTGDSCMLK